MILSRRVPSGNQIWHHDLPIKHGDFHCKVRSSPVCWGLISIPNSAGRIPHPLPQGMWRSTCLSNAKSSRWLGTLRRCPAWLLGLKLPLGSCILGYPICEPWCWYIDLTGPRWFCGKCWLFMVIPAPWSIWLCINCHCHSPCEWTVVMVMCSLCICAVICGTTCLNLANQNHKLLYELRQMKNHGSSTKPFIIHIISSYNIIYVSLIILIISRFSPDCIHNFSKSGSHINTWYERQRQRLVPHVFFQICTKISWCCAVARALAFLHKFPVLHREPWWRELCRRWMGTISPWWRWHVMTVSWIPSVHIE